jgi:hypothetical protein
VALFARRLGKSALDPQNIREFARAMTAEGSSWAVVAPGIVCTNFTDGGLCNKGMVRLIHTTVILHVRIS